MHMHAWPRARCTLLGVALALSAVLVALPARGAAESGAGVLTIVLRYDDWWGSPASSPAKERVDRQVLACARDHGVPLSIALVPAFPIAASLPDVEYAELRPGDPLLGPLIEASQAGAIEVALHGLHHDSPLPDGTIRYPVEGERPDPGYHHYSEFAGRSLTEQRRRIERGLALFAAAGLSRPAVFVPPFNAYDEATYALCAEQRFTVLSGDLRWPAPAVDRSVRIIPETLALRDRSRLGRLMALVERRGESGAVLVMLFHYFDFEESGSERAHMTLSQFDDFLSSLSEDRRVRFDTLAGLAQAGGEAFGLDRLRRAQAFRRRMRKLSATHLVPYRFMPSFDELPVYWPAERYAALNRRATLLLGATWGAIAVAALGVSSVLLVGLRRRPVVLAVCWVAAAGAGVGLALRPEAGRGLCVSAVAAGLLLPVVVAALLRRREPGSRARGKGQDMESETRSAACCSS
jgi:hypothetical protein